MARSMLCISIAHVPTISPLLFLLMKLVAFGFKKEKIKEHGVIIISVSLNVQNLRLRSVLLQA